MNFSRLFHTLRPLRAVQWTDRLQRPLKTRLLQKRFPANNRLDAARDLPKFALPRFFTRDRFDPATGEAAILNLPFRFDPACIDWNFSGHGRLWAYHLNYFGWLEHIDDAALAQWAMLKFCLDTDDSGVGAEIYPASRRIQHWIAAILRHQLHEDAILSRLYRDAWRVARLPEHHLQANHLLQNGLAVLAAAHFFDDESLYAHAECILRKELPRQFFKDGGHIERSASYTADLCARLLWILHLQKHTKRFPDAELTKALWCAASGALSWLDAYSFSDGTLAGIGDSSPDMMPSLEELREAASALQQLPPTSSLRDSGYRKSSGRDWELVINAGSASPHFQPGHSHADTLSFCLNFRGRPMVVDTGISTYERSARRECERSTEAHNTVTVGGKNSSDVWSAFRVGRRAQVCILQEDAVSISASHDGYAHLHVRHFRTFDWSVGGKMIVSDRLEGRARDNDFSFLHFHPDVQLTQLNDFEWTADECRIAFSGLKSIAAESYQFAAGFNLLRPALRLKCGWNGTSTEIRFHF